MQIHYGMLDQHVGPTFHSEFAPQPKKCKKKKKISSGILYMKMGSNRSETEPKLNCPYFS